MFRAVFLGFLLTASSVLSAGKAAAADAPPLWSLIPPSDPSPPAVRNADWPAEPLDRFVLARIEAAGQMPTPQADRRTLARRIWLDLIGLLPDPEELETFLLDNRPDAWARLVDSLLASPHYGEYWGRHWLDVARYADSNGMDEDIAHPDAWRYRDYVIHSFNNDKPFDKFIEEQIAGDLLPAANWEEKRAHTVAAGFLSVGPKMLACDDPDKMRRDIADEQMDTTGRAFLGMTFGCARCHDHKFDPISIEDYYGLAGIFMSTRTLTKYTVVAEIHEHDLSDPKDKERHEQIERMKKRRDESATSPDEKSFLESEITALEKNQPPPYDVMAVTDSQVENVPVHLRGNYQTPGEIVPRRLPLTIAAIHPPPMPAGQSGRLEFARWMGGKENPLSARVIANRVWRWHFGRGIVPTPDNFGRLGVGPTHPELLDYLAHRLMDSGWSLKSLHREILLSATWRQSSQASPALKDSDPENKLYARWLPRRMESEVLRDSILQTSGRLDSTMGGTLLTTAANKYTDRGRLVEWENVPRRTVYLPVLRSSGYDGQNAFDFPDPAVPEGDRRSSVVAPQALYLMNSPLVHESSAALARRMLDATPDASVRDRAAWLIRQLLGREATETERGRGENFLTGFAQEAEGWAAFARVLYSTNEFLMIE